MPAIQPARLKQQAALLAEHFDQPAAFVRSLHHLLEGYAERVARPGQSGGPAILLKTYRVRPPVLRQILIELTPLAKEQPEDGLQLCDALWEQPYLEFRTLASGLLGQIPIPPAEPVVDRLQIWIKPEIEPGLVDLLFTQGMEGLRHDQPVVLLHLIEGWLDSGNLFNQQIGLRALLPLIRYPDYENLPAIYSLIQPLIQSAPLALRPDLLDVLEALARRSPQEMAFMFRQSLSLPGSKNAAWLIRQSLSVFPASLEEMLRKELRGT